MVIKVNVPEKTGKNHKVELENTILDGKEMGEVINGDLIMPELTGYEFEITGLSDKSGFMSMANVAGIGMKRVLFRYGTGMHMKPKGDKKKGTKPNGLRLRKTVRGKTISDATRQVNLKLIKEGSKPIAEIFAPKEEEAPEATEEKKE